VVCPKTLNEEMSVKKNIAEEFSIGLNLACKILHRTETFRMNMKPLRTWQLILRMTGRA
jgi:hypothetical protein